MSQQEILGSYFSDTTIHSFSQQILRTINTTDFIELLNDNDQLEFSETIIIVDCCIKITRCKSIFGFKSEILFINQGALFFPSNDKNSIYKIKGFDIKVQISDKTYVFNAKANLQVMDCIITNKNTNTQNMKECLFHFGSQLYINDTTINGFFQVAQVTESYNSDSIVLHLCNTIIHQAKDGKGIEIKKTKETKIYIFCSQIYEGKNGLVVEDCQQLELSCDQCQLSHIKIGIHLQAIKDGQIDIENNQIQSSKEWAIIIKDIKVKDLNILNNQIEKCIRGLFLSSIIIQNNDDIQPIIISQTNFSSLKEIALFCNEIACITIKGCRISDSHIGINMSVTSDNVQDLQETNKINPYIITIHNCAFLYVQQHALLLNANRQQNSSFIQISRCQFQANKNAIEFSGTNKKNQRKIQVKIHECLFENNELQKKTLQYNKLDYSVQLFKTHFNTQNQNSHCSIM